MSGEIDLWAVLSGAAAVITVVPAAMRLFVTPVIRRLIEDMAHRMERKLNGKLKAQEEMYRALLKNHEEIHHGRRGRGRNHHF